MARINYTEIKGTIRKLSALARRLGFKYRAGDRVFRKSDGTVKAFRTIRAGKTKRSPIFVERVRAAA